ncbi:hypothetical protein QN239_31330 [Mycolicibacterium sp. Y3]
MTTRARRSRSDVGGARRISAKVLVVPDMAAPGCAAGAAVVTAGEAGGRWPFASSAQFLVPSAQPPIVGHPLVDDVCVKQQSRWGWFIAETPRGASIHQPGSGSGFATEEGVQLI